MATAVYPGSFDPITFGHIDIIRRAAAVFDRLVIGVLVNKAKKPLFSTEERIEMLRQAVGDIPGVEIAAFDGLVVDFCKRIGATVIVRGLRGMADVDFEMIRAQTNRDLMGDVDTVFFAASPEYSYVSSSGVRELAAFHGDFTKYVPDFIVKRVEEKYL